MRRYDEAAARLGIVKFVPASGAATRMFKELFAFVEEGRRSEGIDRLLQNIERFAFWPELRATLPAGADDRTVVEHIIGKGLGYGGRPKGLVTFHAYAEGARKAAEEHLVEGAQYAAAGGRVRIHFTVSPEHRADFEALMAEKVPLYRAAFRRALRHRLLRTETLDRHGGGQSPTICSSVPTRGRCSSVRRDTAP